MRFVFKMIVFPFWLLTAFLALMLKWTLNLSAFVLALPMLYIFGCGLYTLYCREWMQFLILLVAEFGCFLLITAGTVIVEAVEWFSGQQKKNKQTHKTRLLDQFFYFCSFLANS